MTGRAYMGEVLAEIHQEISELLHKQVNTQTKKSFRGPRKLPQAHEKVCDENETKKKKRRTHKNVIDGRKPFITPKQKTGANNLHELLGNDCGYNEGTICVVNGCISINRMVFRAWAHERVPLNSQWLVLRIGGTDFLHCQVADSTYMVRTC